MVEKQFSVITTFYETKFVIIIKNIIISNKVIVRMYT